MSERFNTSDVRFSKLSNKKRKLQVDSRFKRMFEDEAFQTKYTTDKYGRKIKSSIGDDIKKFYTLKEDEEKVEEEEEENNNNEIDNESDVENDNNKEINENDDDSAQEDIDEDDDVDADVEDNEYDPARGIGNQESDSELSGI